MSPPYSTSYRIITLIILFAYAGLIPSTSAIAVPHPRSGKHRRLTIGGGVNGSEIEVLDASEVESREWDAAQGDGNWNAFKAILAAAASSTTPPATLATPFANQLLVEQPSPLPVITQVVTAYVYETITRTHDVTIGAVDSTSTSMAATPSATTPTSFTSLSTPAPSSSSPGPTPNGKLVFAHFMSGIVSGYTVPDWQADMTLAQTYGIDGFALNIGTDDYTDLQLGNAYTAAGNVGFKVFISFDFSYYNDGMVPQISAIISKYVDRPAQFLVNGAAYVSTFIGDGFPWNQVAASTGKNLYVVPNWQASSAGDFASTGISGLFSWLAWPSTNNAPIDQLMKAVGPTYDQEYLAVTQPSSKTYMAPVSPWFSTHFASKNYIFLAETLWYDRWTDILAKQDDLEYLEIVSWNDFGESHYVGPYNTPHTDDGSSQWAAGMPHMPLLDFAKPYINAFKSGLSTPIVTENMLIFWYRPTLKDASCDESDTVHSKPNGYEMMSDSVFVVAFATSPGQVTVNSGSNAPFVQAVQSGVTLIQVPMASGQQSFAMTTVLGSSLSGAGGVDVSGSCWNGSEYNYNIFSGSISG